MALDLKDADWIRRLPRSILRTCEADFAFAALDFPGVLSVLPYVRLDSESGFTDNLIDYNLAPRKPFELSSWDLPRLWLFPSRPSPQGTPILQFLFRITLRVRLSGD